MKSFNRIDWERFMSRIKGMNIQTLEDSYDKHTGNIVNIRHDVDADIESSSIMAHLEFLNRIKSTYFILDTGEYWGVLDRMAEIHRIRLAGHNIGWHNNAVTRHLLTGKPLIDCINDPLEILRKYAPVTGTASHGDPLCHKRGYLNYYAFGSCLKDDRFPNTEVGAYFALEYFGLKYESYHTGHTHYISDSGGAWQQDNEAVISDFEKKGGKLQILIHPQWWDL